MEARLLQQAKNKLTVEQIAKELAEKQTIAERCFFIISGSCSAVARSL